MRYVTFFCLLVLFCIDTLFAETGNDLSLNPDKYLEKTVSLKGYIGSRSPTLAANDSGKFFIMDTFKSKRVSSGNQTSNSFESDGYVKVFVPNDKVSSFVASFKTDTPKGFSGVFRKYVPKNQDSNTDAIEKSDSSFYYIDLTPKNPKW